MFRTKVVASVVVRLLVATATPTLAAGEPVGTAPPSNSIHDWMTKPSATPAAPTLAAGGPMGTTRPAQSIREWMTTPTAATTPCMTATPIASSTAMPSVSAAVAKSPITISFTSTLRQGKLVVELDDVPIFNEKFQKPLLLISQTTTWDPLQIVAGKHRLSAKVYGAKKTYLSATYDLDVSRTKASKLRFVMQGDKLTVEMAS
jgi:hypothetical protein